MQDKHLLAPTQAIPPEEVPEGPPTAALGAGRPIGAPVVIRASTPLESQDSNHDLAAHIAEDTALLKELRWHQFVAYRRSKSNFASLNKVDHPAQRLLKFYKERGAPVKMATKPWL